MEGVEDVEGWVGHDFDRAFAGRCEEVEVWGGERGDVVGEGGSVRLDGLGMRFEGCVGCLAVSRGAIRGSAVCEHSRGRW